ncbi:MAG: hypothetical protein HQ513_11615 [Rhodospirillales bacterium]|nr:hypothetical protein [Rhodospirillales bacterium]
MQENKLILRLMRHKVTLAAAVFSLFYVYMYSFINIDLFKLLVASLEIIEESNSEELFLGIVFVLTGFLIDNILYWRKKVRKREIDKVKLATLRATMATVHDVVNNFLNSLLIFRLEAEKSAAMKDESLKMLDDLTTDTAGKLREIDDLENIFERDFGSGISGIVIPASQGQANPNP